MKQLLMLMLCCLVLGHLTAWAQDDPNIIVFHETFDQTNGTGGRDGVFTGNVGSSTIKYDTEGWTATSCGGASQCVKFGTTKDSGSLTSPEISVGNVDYVLLTFSAAGWGDSNKNKLYVETSDGFTIVSGDYDIVELENGLWNDYTVLIKVNDSSKPLKLTFMGKRGFLDDVVVRAITNVPTPSLQDEFTFFPNTTEENASKHVTLTPANYTVAYYTTDGSTPSKTNGTEAIQTTGVPIHGTTTVKAIAYVGDMASEVVTKTYTQGNTVNGIAAFKALANGTEVRLFLADEDNARVLHGHDGKQLYLRDNSGTLCLDFDGKAVFNPAPAHNQHVAGWIVGKKQAEAGYSLLKLVATDNTTTDFLALAAPVTEPDTQPTIITPDGGGNFDFSQNVGDWVKASNVRIGTNASIENPFNTELVASKFEFRQLVDLSGIVLDCSDVDADTRVAPVYYNGIKPVVYVIDENEDYVCPADNIENATVRLKRSLSKDYWNTFVVPFDIASFNGEIREYSSLDGKTMQFTKTDEMRAGIPYLVKPNEDITDPVYSNVTLTSMHATFVNKGGDYYFTGTYGPYNLSTDKRHMFLTTDGKLAYPEDLDHRQLKGMRAYIEMLNGAPAPSMAIEGDATGISEVRSMTEDGKNDIYDLQGRKVQNPGKGLYIVNGKKVIIQ